MNLRLKLVCCVIFTFLQHIAHAQINVELQFSRMTFLCDEPAVATLRFTNMAGRDVTLGTPDNSDPWCQIQVSSVRGENPSLRQTNPKFPPLFIASGETVSRSINVNDVYDISMPGQYRIRASILFSDTKTQIVTSPAYITTEPGKTLWTTTVGVPENRENSGSIRTFSVLQSQRKEGLFLYAKLQGAQDGWRFPPYLLGRMLTAMPPQMQIDRENNLYVFHAVNDDTYTLSQIDVATGRSGQANYRSKTPRNGRPSLRREPDGRLVISGGIRITAEEIAPSTAPDRSKLSDRPAGF